MTASALPSQAAPLFTLKGLPVAVLLALLLCWPVVATGHLRGFADTNSYLKGGDAIWRIVAEFVLPRGSPAVTGAGEAGPAEARAALPEEPANLYGRSVTYAALFGALVRIGGPATLIFAQALAISLSILALIDRAALDRPVLLAAGLLAVVALSPLAWMTVYLMPDVLGAVVLIFAALLVRRFDAFGTGQKVALTLLAAFAVSSHYGNIPLAVGAVGAALAARALAARRAPAAGRARAAVAAGLVAVAAAPLLNIAASFAVLGEVSMTPLRPPVLLARSIEDGPARWYLEDACAESTDEMCAAFRSGVPQTPYDLLWGSRDGEATRTIRENELGIVIAAAREYPLLQLQALARNTWRQFVLFAATGSPMTWDGIAFQRVSAEEDLGAWRMTMTLTALAASGALALLALAGRLTRPQVEILALVVIGLIGNAFIFGALSAPADRYQARIVWLLPLLAVLFIAERRGSRTATAAAPRGPR